MRNFFTETAIALGFFIWVLVGIAGGPVIFLCFLIYGPITSGLSAAVWLLAFSAGTAILFSPGVL